MAILDSVRRESDGHPWLDHVAGVGPVAAATAEARVGVALSLYTSAAAFS